MASAVVRRFRSWRHPLKLNPWFSVHPWPSKELPGQGWGRVIIRGRSVGAFRNQRFEPNTAKMRKIAESLLSTPEEVTWGQRRQILQGRFRGFTNADSKISECPLYMNRWKFRTGEHGPSTRGKECVDQFGGKFGQGCPFQEGKNTAKWRPTLVHTWALSCKPTSETENPLVGPLVGPLIGPKIAFAWFCERRSSETAPGFLMVWSFQGMLENARSLRAIGPFKVGERAR